MPKKNTEITDAELALLSLLMESPMHGYQIEQTIEERGMREWTPIGFSSIYYLLERMKEKSWLASSLAQSSGKGPARQVFQITPAGKKVWRAAVLSALGNPQRTSGNFILGLANIIMIGKEELLKAMKEYRDRLQERLAHVQTKLDSYGSNLPWEVEKLFDYSLFQIKAEQEWVEKFTRELAERSK